MSAVIEGRQTLLSMLRDKRTLLVLMVLIFTAVWFWSTSRVPALNEKALMGGDTQLDALGFDIVFDVQPDDPLWQRVTYTTINWMKTNQNGMVFGILFASILMTMLSLFRKRSFDSGFNNTLLGMAIGAPLGVCVNCAAPIAQGLRSGGAQTQTMLAAMISSPTLNIIVLTMLFSLFPLYMVAIKLGLTLFFIVICIPLFTRMLATDEDLVLDQAVCKVPLATVTTETESLVDSVIWTVKALLNNLWYIVKKTVPLMILAGFLGSLLVTATPLDRLVEVLPSGSLVATLLTMSLMALIGLTLPVPIAFDVIVVAVLLAAGLPVHYAMILLFTLGIFSIYAFFIAWGSVSKRLLIILTFVLLALGLVAGVLGKLAYDWQVERENQLFISLFSEESAASVPSTLEFGGDTRQQAGPNLLSELQETAISRELIFADPEQGIAVEAASFAPRVTETGLPFKRMEGKTLGLDEPYTYSVMNFLELDRYRGIATGDVHNDGWPDILLTSPNGISLYVNRNGEKFELQSIGNEEIDNYWTLVPSLVDVNNDGWLDIFFTTYRDGNWVILNVGGDFSTSSPLPVPNIDDAIATTALGFGDVDQDGDLDAVFGNWTVGVFGNSASPFPASRNAMALNDGGGFGVQNLQGPVGETLSTLFYDLDDDGYLDLLTGTDFDPADVFYRGDGKGAFEILPNVDPVFPHSTHTTMSIVSADVDNDLEQEIYVAQISKSSGGGSGALVLNEVGPEICVELEDTESRADCEQMMSIQRVIVNSRAARSVFRCQELPEDFVDDCMAVHLLQMATRNKEEAEKCKLFPPGWSVFSFVCNYSHGEREVYTEEELASHIPQIRNHNMLFKKGEDGKFVDVGADMGVAVAGWTWNARFADLDNDGWQDLYAVNGQMLRMMRESNVFYRNERGSRFSKATDQYGLGSFFATSAYSYMDYDNDGDLDIISLPTEGPVLAYENNMDSGNAIAFELRDYLGNRFGVGSRVIIHYADGQTQMREISQSGGFVSFDAPVAMFGLGEHKVIDRVEIVWSTGERIELDHQFDAGRRYLVTRQQQSLVQTQ